LEGSGNIRIAARPPGIARRCCHSLPVWSSTVWWDRKGALVSIQLIDFHLTCFTRLILDWRVWSEFIIVHRLLRYHGTIYSDRPIIAFSKHGFKHIYPKGTYIDQQ
jgi:hypothetical protein